MVNKIKITIARSYCLCLIIYETQILPGQGIELWAQGRYHNSDQTMGDAVVTRSMGAGGQNKNRHQWKVGLDAGGQERRGKPGLDAGGQGHR